MPIGRLQEKKWGWMVLWEPYFADSSIPHYCIFISPLDVISKDCFYSNRCILAFPNKEIRDAFFENFKDLIEECKELL